MVSGHGIYIRVLAPLICVVFGIQFAWSFHRAWAHTESDFPSYYTAARLLVEGKPLRDFYDMPRFQQHMDALAVPNQLGGYIPQTPLTMLPFVPLTNLGMYDAKRVWLIADLVFLAGTGWLLTRITSFAVWEVLGLFVLGFGSLHTNLELGQYYVFLLFLFTLAGYFLVTGREFAGGGTLGLICSLKLVTLPFIVYFAWRKQWRAMAGMCVALGLSCLVALALFDWSDLKYYFGAIWPRSMAGETLDPFNPANGTLVTLLRRILVPEPELNPAPLFDSPSLFFFLHVFLTLSILSVSLLAFGRAKSVEAGYAGFLVTLLLLSPNTASYTFLLLLLPAALLFESAGRRNKIILLLCYFLLALPMNPGWNWLFPKVWLLVAMFGSALAHSGRLSRNRTVALTLSAALFTSLFIARVETTTYKNETHRRWQRIAVEQGAIYSSYPIPVSEGLIYQSIKDGFYRLRLRRGGSSRDFVVDGNSFNPTLFPHRDLVGFEAVRGGITHRLVIDPAIGIVSFPGAEHFSAAVNSASSPDGNWMVCKRPSWGQTQLYLVDRTRHAKPIQVTEGSCSSFAPAWERDSQAIVFASDCGRGVRMPALYRAPLTRMLSLTR